MGQAKQELTVGMVAILALVGVNAVLLLVAALRASFYQLGPVVLSGAGAVVMNVVVFGILAAIFYGILQRMKWARNLAIGWYVVSMVLLLVNLLSFLSDKTMYDRYYEQILSPELRAVITPTVIGGSLAGALGFGIVVGFVIIIYLTKKKDFFVN